MKVISLLIYLSLCLIKKCDLTRPKISVMNGDLTFISSWHKNISFRTLGKGRVNINGIDLTTAALLTENAATVLKDYRGNFANSLKRIDKLGELVEGNDGILQRLYTLETNSKAVYDNSSTASYYSMKIRTLTRRLRILQRKIINFQYLLTTDECSSNPCKNGGTCRDLFNSFMCHCPNEWEGSFCEKDVNECVRFAGTDLGCQNGATCINKLGTYECTCTRGWFGLHCTRRSADCNSGSGTELCGHGTCISQNSETGYKCICDQGWTTDGTNLACTVDVNECTMNKPPCSTNPLVPCINVPGSFYCGNCPAGYTGNGYYCTDIDECQIFNGGCSVTPMVQCINTPGSRMCGLCPPGYTGNGQTCSYAGVCNINNGGCHHLAICRENPRISSTYVECLCPSGYTGTGIGPEGCKISQNTDACLSNPCKHGTCSVNNITGDYNCRCFRRYSGRNCETLRDPCVPNPCLNGGTCNSVLGIIYRCYCPAEYSGSRCSEERQACGGRLKDESGILKYPSIEAQTYEHQISCSWTIETNKTKILKINFTRFNLESSAGCQYDWVQIHDGRNSAAHSIGRFCGNKLPNGGVFTTTHNIIYLWFRSDHSIAHTGFELNWSSVEPVCGDSITAKSHGTIRSPGSPGNYPVNRDCYWNLLAPLSKRFVFHFFSLIIGNDSNCNGDYLEFTSGLMSTESAFAKFCNTSHPPPLFSPGPEVLLHFHSDAQNSYAGFQITYSVVEGIPGCGGVYTMEHADIRSPTVDGQYPPDVSCEYKISLTTNARIKLNFLSFELEESLNCQFDYIKIFAGSSLSSPLIGKYCGSELPPDYVSYTNELLIVFRTDWATAKTGFHLTYETICGGKYTSPSGLIESPGYPNVYYPKKVCIYEIVQPLGTSITLSMVDFDIEQNTHPFCNYDFLEIRDGDNENSTLIGKYCGKIPPKIISTHNYLWLKFKSDANVLGKGFLANYTTTKIGCGGILKDKVGTISSPNHPTIYSSSSKCIWIISAPPKNVIQIFWMNFHLEISVNCAYDSVSVYDNNTDSGMGGLMGKFCGVVLPPLLLSSSNIVTIIFKSDATVNYEGFLLTYTFIQDHTICGGNYYTEAGIIKSPNYPQNYPTNRECTWTINVPSGQQIMLNVTDFSMESYSNCRYDWLEIRNGGTAASPLIGKYCATIPQLIPSHTNRLYLHFKSDMTKSGRGFKITWDSTITGCGGSLTAPTGSIISPHYPEPYNRNSECIWKISVSAGSIIQIVFADLDLEQHSRCVLDYIEFFDGLDVNSKTLGKFCSSQHPAFITSTKNHLLVKFRSDISIQGRGFQIRYSAICNNTVKGYRGVIESPNFPNSYPHNLNCNWNIEVFTNNKINITFTHFELERTGNFANGSSGKCLYDYVELKHRTEFDDERKDEFITYDTFCGSKPPEIITLNSDKAQIHFVSDNLLFGAGFRLEWQLEGCGGILTHNSGTITTPNYPNAYPASIECNWVIQVDYGNSVEITFNKVDVERDESCSYDFIKIYNGQDNSYPMLTHFCHQVKPVVVSSSGNNMFIQFIADGSYHGEGFSATYITNPTKCGGKYTASEGTLVSPNYPKNYEKNETCGYSIEIDEHHIIELEFEDLDLARTCKTTNIKVYDGPTAAYPVLAEICGNNKPNNTIKSSYNMMYIEMRTGTTFTAKGFLAKYYKGCGAIISASSNGLIENTLKTTVSMRQENCSWTILSDNPRGHVSLTINHMSSSNHYCDDNYYTVFVYNGRNSDAPRLGSYCETKLPPMLTSDGSSMHIEIRSDVDFFATYSVYDSTCGGNLLSVDGYFASPGYPNKYPINTECEWIINISEGNHVTLRFIVFDLLESDNCNTDFLEIRDKNSTGKLLGVFCGDTIPTNITNVGSLWLLFKTSKPLGEISVKGFYAEYSLSTSNQLSGLYGLIASPLYPLTVSDYQEYSWTITVQFGYRILLTFKNIYIENDFSEQCFITTLEIFDGVDEKASLLGTFCGFTPPPPIKSTSNVVYIRYYSGNSKLSSKFLLEWLQVNRENSLLSPSPQKNVTGCNLNETITIVNSTRGFTLLSPGYPNGYSPNLNCEWIFSSSSNNHWEIFINKISLGSLHLLWKTCYHDYLQFYDRKEDDDDWKLKSTVCHKNSVKDDYIKFHNLLKIRFITNGYGNGSGFSLVLREVCGNSILGKSGIIDFDNKTMLYPECQWNITVRPGKTIEVEFKLNNINPVGKCNNYIMLRNGHLPDSPILGKGKYCESEKFTKLQTSGNYLYIKYSGSKKIKGFQIKYREISFACGGEIKLNRFANSTEISSPNYPNIPSPHTECSWIISGPPGEALQIDFEERFDLTTNKDCSTESVEIRDGGSPYSPLIGKYCEEAPGTQYSTDNMLFIKFFTNVDDPKNGFKAKISLKKCGGTVKGNNGEIKSPFYGVKNMYPKNINCTWYFIGPQSHNLNLKFNKIELPTSKKCNSVDHVTISEYNELNKTEIILGTYCGRSIPDNIKSASNKVKIQFQTGNTISNLAGFNLKVTSSLESCGGKLNTETGFIESPGYPLMNHQRRKCLWTIIVPYGRRITLEILDLDLEPLNDQVLAFFNDENFKSNIRYLHSTDKTRTIRSSENVMMIIYLSLHSSNRRGFKAKYTSNEETICKGDFNQDGGIITQPLDNTTPYHCTWKMETNIHLNQTLSLAIQANINSNLKFAASTCTYAASVISLTPDKSNERIAQVCKTTPEPVIARSPFPINKITAVQARSLRMNFTITLKVNRCGGLINGEQGFITSPNFSNKNSNDIDCAWLLTLPTDQAIKINFTSFNLGNDCQKNYLDIYNGPSPLSPRIGRYCHNNNPIPIQTQFNSVWINYRADKENNRNGFNLTYDPTIKGCGGIFHTARVIETPKYPKNYPNNAECLWEIRGQEGYHIGLRFTDRFHLEQSNNCENDFVEIWDWKNNDWVSLGRKCGREIPKPVNSTSNRMKILFRTNNEITANGFKAFWDLNCGGTFVADSIERYIVSPGYPDIYKANLNCQYNIVAGRKIINIKFIDFNLEEGSPDCKYDNLTILYYYSSLSYKNSEVFCGNDKPGVIQTPTSITIKLKTDNWLNRKGFKLAYKEEGCDGVITSSTSISLPSVNIWRGSLYNSQTICTWNITAPLNKLVVVEIEKLKLTSSRNCTYTNVEIFDGNKKNQTNRLALLCGNNDNLPKIISRSNSMIIASKSNRYLRDQQFKANIYFTSGPKEGCGGNIELNNEKTIQSPQNLQDVNCIWTLIAPYGYSIELRFQKINLVVCRNELTNKIDNCGCNSIEIRDGGGLFSEVIEKFCNISTTKEIKYYTTGNKALINLYLSDINNNAFKLTAKPLLSPCGPVIRNVTNQIQILNSPNYPNKYPDDIKCIWILKINESSTNQIYIRFKEFDLIEENALNSCKQDKLILIDNLIDRVISDGLGPEAVLSQENFYIINPSGNSPERHHYCGKYKIPFDFYSQSNIIKLVFSSEGLNTNRGKGFSLEYKIADCNRNYTSEQGRLVHQFYNQDCYISINVPKNYTISVYFQRFYFPVATDCTDSAISIYDGPNNSSKQLLKVCGYTLPSPVFSTSNQLTIRIWKHPNNQRLAIYDLVYTSSDKGRGCGGTLYNYKGAFSSPFYPNDNRNDTFCVWDIRVPEGLTISLKFIEFDLQAPCSDNYLVIAFYNTRTRYKYCKDDTPATIKSPGSRLKVEYQSSVNNGGRGWFVKFQAENDSISPLVLY